METSHPKVPELIYGTLLVMALVGAMAELHAGTSEAFAALLGSGVALWFAHSYSTTVGIQLQRGRYLNRREIWSVLRDELFVVAILPLPLTLLVLAEVGLFSTTTALRLSAWGGVAILFIAGVTVARQTAASSTWTIVAGLGHAALGGVIILLEYIFAH